MRNRRGNMNRGVGGPAEGTGHGRVNSGLYQGFAGGGPEWRERVRVRRKAGRV